MKRLWILSLAVGPLLLGAGCGKGPSPALRTAKVERGDLTLSVESRGELNAEHAVKVCCPRLTGSRGNIKITKLVPEGTDVKAGDVIVELDKADLQTNLKKAESDVKEEAADLEKARKTLTVEREKLAADAKKLKADEEIKQLELGLVESLPTTSDMVSAETDLETAKVVAKLEKQDYDPLCVLHKSGHTTDQDLEIAALELKHAQINLERKKMIYDLVAKGADEFARKRAVLAVQLAHVAFEQAQTKLEYETKKLEEDIRAAEADLELATKERQRRADAVEAATLKAPCAGTVLYARVWQSAGEEKVTEGMAVWTYNQIVSLPDLHAMVAEVWVEESQIGLIRLGQRATLKMDAIKDVEFQGKVSEVGNVTTDKGEARGRAAWLYGGEGTAIRVFKVKVKMDQYDPRVRPGLNGNVKIIVEEMKNVLSIPEDGVFRRDGCLVSYVKEGRRLVPRPIETGKSAEGKVVILKGLAEGEEISLTAPENLE